MTFAEKKNVVSILSGTTDQNVLSTYLTLAERKVLNRVYPFDGTQTVVPERYEMLECELATFLINKRGAEGQTSHNENGISRSYEGEEKFLSEIVPFVGVV